MSTRQWPVYFTAAPASIMLDQLLVSQSLRIIPVRTIYVTLLAKKMQKRKFEFQRDNDQFTWLLHLLALCFNNSLSPGPSGLAGFQQLMYPYWPKNLIISSKKGHFEYQQENHQFTWLLHVLALCLTIVNDLKSPKCVTSNKKDKRTSEKSASLLKLILASLAIVFLASSIFPPSKHAHKLQNTYSATVSLNLFLYMPSEKPCLTCF